jgi:DNA-binding NtrC family response regulator
MKRYRILLVDDDPLVLTGIRKDLESGGYEVETAADGEAAIEILEHRFFEVVITDLIMGKADGIKVLKKAKSTNPETMVIILTGYGNMTSAIDALRLDADDYMLKPCEPEEMFFRITRSIEKLETNRKVKLYETLLPVCCVCNKIRDDIGKEPGTGDWMGIQQYLWKRGGLSSTSTYCPACAEKAMNELEKE